MHSTTVMKVKFSIQCALAFVSVTIPSVLAYSTGATSESCYNLGVVHVDSFSGLPADPANCQQPCQFSIEVVATVVSETNRTRVTEGSISTYDCDTTYEVVVSSIQNRFEGFLVEARASTESGDFREDSSIWGEWISNQSDRYHTVDCNRSINAMGGTFPGAATQNFASDKINVTLYWKAPRNPTTQEEAQELPESLVFWAAIVQEQLTFFLPIKGSQLVRNQCTFGGTGDQGSCVINYPISTLEPSTAGASAQCPSEQERSEVLESIHEDIRTRIREVVLPYLQGDSDSCDSP